MKKWAEIRYILLQLWEYSVKRLLSQRYSQYLAELQSGFPLKMTYDIASERTKSHIRIKQLQKQPQTRA